MRVFVTGATGFIGSAVVSELIAAGHDVTGLARSDASARALAASGAKVHRGSIEDLACLRRAASAADGAIHTAFFHAFSHASLALRLRAIFGGLPGGIGLRFLQGAIDTERRAIEALGNSLAGADRSLVIIAPTMALAPGRLATEDDSPDANAVGGPRGRSEAVARALASRGVRASIVRLPPSVHDRRRAGLVDFLIDAARKTGNSAYVGDGANRWAAVHRLDAARLMRVALEKGAAGAVYHGVAEEGIPLRTIAAAIGRKRNVPLVGATPEQAARLFGFAAPFVGTDNPVSSGLTQDRLDWHPSHPGLIADLDQGEHAGT